MRDHLSDFITRIRNGQKKKLKKIQLQIGVSKLILNILNIFYYEGYIRGYKINRQLPLTIDVFLKYNQFGEPAITKIKRVSRPSKRIYSNKKINHKINNGVGTVILSTPKGVLSQFEAILLNQGGEILFIIT